MRECAIRETHNSEFSPAQLCGLIMECRIGFRCMRGHKNGRGTQISQLGISVDSILA